MKSLNTDMRVRYLNGYRLLYLPSHEHTMTSSNWDGFVYEHILVAELNLNRRLADNEVVHHLDMDRLNNRIENLIVLDRGQHWKLHQWLNKGASLEKSNDEQGMNSVKSNSVYLYCEVCGITLQRTQTRFCGFKCENVSVRKARGNRTIPIPSTDELVELLKTNSKEGIGRMYNVTGNAVKKWMKRYNIDMTILSQVKDASLEGAETSGEVQSS